VPEILGLLLYPAELMTPNSWRYATVVLLHLKPVSQQRIGSARRTTTKAETVLPINPSHDGVRA
jgi:hypothetical protein